MQTLILIIITTILMTAAAVAEPGPLPQVSGFTYAGNGCPRGTADGQLEDNGNFGITFDKLEAFTSAQAARVAATCRFSVDVQPEAGWRMSIRRVILNGIYEVSAHGRGWIKTSYGLDRQGWEPFWAKRDFLARHAGDFEIDDGMDDYPWSDCGEKVRVAGTIEVGAQRGNGPGEYTEVIVQNGVVRGQQRVVWQWVYEPCDDDGDPDRPLTLDGRWRSRYETETGQVVQARLDIDGNHGTYDIGAAVGTLSGLRQTGDVVRGHWRLGQYNGWIELRLKRDGTFDGIWGRGTGTVVGGRWWGERN